MKKPKKPRRPRKPSKPEPPKTKYEQAIRVWKTDADFKFEEVADLKKLEVIYKKIISEQIGVPIQIISDIKLELVLRGNVQYKIPNQAYEKELVKYQEKFEKYEKRMESYNERLKKYEKEKRKYDINMKLYEAYQIRLKEDLIKEHIKSLQTELKQIELEKDNLI